MIKAELIDHMGTDLTVVNAARVSFDKVSSNYSDDKNIRLIKYLAKHDHFTPFTHCMITLRETVPLFIARQRFKHNVGFTYNEESRRYIDDDPVFYKPDMWRKKSVEKKQGSTDEEVWITPPTGFCLSCDSPLITSRACEVAKKRYCSTKCQQRHDKVRNYPRYRMRHWKNSANKRGLEFNLDVDDVQFPVTCPYLEIELDYDATKWTAESPSLDRIDSSKGYVKGNVQVISSLANTMKNSASTDMLMTFAKNVSMMHGGVILKSANSIDGVYTSMLALYRKAIADGVAPEMARMLLPQATMTSYYVTGSLAAFARAYKLRIASDSQYEIQLLAKQWNEIIEPLYPESWKALTQ